MNPADYDRLVEAGATRIDGLFPDSSAHILTSPDDGSASLWVTEGDHCSVVLLDPAAVEAAAAVLAAGLIEARGTDDA